MASTVATGTRHAIAPAERMPLAVGLCALAAGLSIVQGLAEFALPLALGAEPFGLSRALAALAGGPGLFAAILLHNLGLALLLPGCGLIAAHHESDARRRGLVGPILVAAVLGAIGVGVWTLFAAGGAHLAFLLPLALAEGAAILLVARATHRELRGLAAGAATWRDVRQAMRTLRPTIAIAAVALASLALAETVFLAGWA